VEPQINATLAIELLVFRVDFFELDSEFLLGFDVKGFPDFAKGATAQFFGELVVLRDDLPFHQL
jgi:hypothetical protein